MRTKLVCTAVALSVLASVPAYADYYVVRDESTEECKVVETLPEEETWVQVGPVTFSSYDEAEQELVVVCEEE